MTLEERLENLEEIEKQVKKLQKKGMKILTELEIEDSYKGYGDNWARKDFESSISWMFDSIETKRKFALKYKKEETK